MVGVSGGRDWNVMKGKESSRGARREMRKGLGGEGAS